VGSLDEALKNATQAIAIREAISSDNRGSDALIRTHLAGDYGSMAQILSTAGKLASAVANQQQAVSILTSLVAQNPNDQTIKSFLGQAELYLGVIFERYGNLDQAKHNGQRATQIFTTLLAIDPNNAFTQQYLGLADGLMGRLEVSSGQSKRALRSFEMAVEIFERLRTRDPNTPAMLGGLGESYMGMGSANMALARNAATRARRVHYLRRARVWYQKSLSTWQELRSRDALEPLDKNRPQETAHAVAECDANLARLGALAN
jgi:tetratricopeptide (TPR) repeat protein